MLFLLKPQISGVQIAPKSLAAVWVSLKRYVTNEQDVDLTFYVSSIRPDGIDSFILEIKEDFPGIAVTILDQRNLPPM